MTTYPRLTATEMRLVMDYLAKEYRPMPPTIAQEFERQYQAGALYGRTHLDHLARPPIFLASTSTIAPATQEKTKMTVKHKHLTKKIKDMTTAEAIADASRDVRNLIAEAEAAAALAAALANNPNAVEINPSDASYYDEANTTRVGMTFTTADKEEADKYVDPASYQLAAIAQAAFAETVQEAALLLSDLLYANASDAAKRLAHSSWKNRCGDAPDDKERD